MKKRRVNQYDGHFRSFNKARKFVHSLKLKNVPDWEEYRKSDKIPFDIPHTPNRAYKKEWISYGDWLGTGTIANRNRKFRPFEEARKFARSLKLKNQDEWMEYSKSDERPSDIPTNPHNAYKNDGWKSLGDFLGNWRTRVEASRRASFEKARKFARSLKLKSSQEWHEYCKSGKKSDDIPADAYRSYINKGWKSWDDFLGTGTIRKYTKDNTRPFNEAREFVHSLKLKNQSDWKKYLKSG